MGSKRRDTVVIVVIIMMIFASYTRANGNEVCNGGFEDDGQLNNISIAAPNCWDVNVPSTKFYGEVTNEWQTEGTYSLKLYSQWSVTFDINDMAFVSQDVYLTDVNVIYFDVILWRWPTARDLNDPNASAILMIDDDVVWDSNLEWPDNEDGEYLNRFYEVDQIYKDANSHVLSVGIRINVDQLNIGSKNYVTHWDFIVFGECKGFGYLLGDVDRDCSVGWLDLKMLAEKWLDEVDSNDQCNLFNEDDLGGTGIINFFDFSEFGKTWDSNWVDLKGLVEIWLEEVESGSGTVPHMYPYCLGHWKMNDDYADTTVVDSSGYGNDGTFDDVTGDPNTDAHSVAGKINGALSFDGTDDFVDIGNVIDTGPYTKVAWVKREAGDVANNIISGNTGHAFWDPNFGSFLWSHKLSAGHNGTWDIVQDSNTLQAGVWHHVAVTFDPVMESGKMVLYKNGVPVDTATSVPAPVSSTTTYIGSYNGVNCFKGSIDNVMIFDRALTAEEIGILYNAGAGTETIPAGDEYNLFTGDDLDPNGIINFPDFGILAEDWLKSSFD